MPAPKRWQWVAQPGPMPTPCWIWTGSTKGNGYPQMSSRRGVPPMAHRVYRAFFRGPIPEGMTVDHLCFQKLCVNPEHLDVCSTAENNARWRASTHYVRPHAHTPRMTDEERRARSRERSRMERLAPPPAGHAYKKPIGPQPKPNGRAKLTPELVAAIKAEYRTGKRGIYNPHGCYALGKKYGVHHTSILFIVHGKTWREVS